MEAAVREVQQSTASAEVGKVYQGRVTGIKDFGAFVEILPGMEGLVHISELANFRVQRVEDVIKLGEQIWVKCINVDEGGKIRLSRRQALEDKDQGAGGGSGEPPPPAEAKEQPSNRPPPLYEDGDARPDDRPPRRPRGRR
jgi:polyribonucleotide nucleotidyltransferase